MSEVNDSYALSKSVISKQHTYKKEGYITMYVPLEFCQKNDAFFTKPDTKLGRILRLLMKSPDKAIMFLHDDSEFLNSDYNGQYLEINQFIQAEKSKIMKMLKLDSSLKNEETKAYIRDFLMSFLFIEVWKSDKEVYRFDPELEFTLSDTEDVKVPIRILDRIPYQTFYLEFAEDGIYSSHFHGAFIHLIKDGLGYRLFIMRLTEDGKSMFGNASFIPDIESDNAVFIVSKGDDTTCGDSEKDIDWPEFCMFQLNALLYLCSENAEIRENLVTQNTYRPSTRIKHKFSEIRKYDCGFVYGSEIRKIREHSVKEKMKSDIKIEKSKPKGPMRPHTRKAHWHHYWTGKGRKELVLRWIAPTVVGLGEHPATIHRVH